MTALVATQDAKKSCAQVARLSKPLAGSDVEVDDVERALLDELAPRIDFIAHQI
jgi:hypothetical protein